MSRIGRFLAYWWENLKAANEGKEMIAPRLAFLIGLVILACRHVGIQHLISESQIAKWVEWLALGYAGFVFFLWLPFRRHEEKEKEVDTLQEMTKSKLEVEGVESEVLDTQGICRIRITNKGLKTADDVRADLVNCPGTYSPWGFKFPKPLKPSASKPRPSMNPLRDALMPEAPKDQSLHPGESVELDLLVACRDTNPNPDGRYSVWVQLSVPGDPLSTTTHPYKMEENYLVKLRVAARDFPESEQELNMLFSGQLSVCRFTLTKVQPCTSKTQKPKAN